MLWHGDVVDTGSAGGVRGVDAGPRLEDHGELSIERTREAETVRDPLAVCMTMGPTTPWPDHGLSECSRGQSFDHGSVVVAQVQIGVPCSSLSIATRLLIRAESTQPLKSP